jgi:mannose-6-phosphate isomerase-like protein (cupin superfamily)/DNA-binding XRE family transcriptional regulator
MRVQEKIRQVASRVRELREIAGVTVGELARDVKVSEEEYAAFESGSADIPLGVLYGIAARFGVELAAVLTGEQPRLLLYSLVRAGDGPSVERRTEHQYQSLAPNFAHMKAEPFLVTVSPAESAARPGRHPGQEFIYVLEGELEVRIDGHEVLLHPGDSLYLDSGRPHALRAAGAASARLLAVILERGPAGALP